MKCKHICLIVIASITLTFSILLYDKHPPDRFIYRFGRLTRKLGQQHLEVSRIQIPIKNLPPHLNNTKIVHLSDLHYDARESDTLNPLVLQEAIRLTNLEKPDLVFLTGDFVNWDPYDSADEISKKLREIQCPKVYGVLGSHDTLVARSFMVAEKLQNIGNITMLDNKMQEDVLPGLTVVGLPCPLTNHFRPEEVLPELKKKIDEGKKNIVIALSHHPDTAQCLLQDRSCSYGVNIDLLLAGHTHGGQVSFPISRMPIMTFIMRYFPSLVTMAEKILKMKNVTKNWEWASGLFKFVHDDNTSWMYVNRGLGAHFNFRLFCPPELTIIQLVSAEL